MLVVVVSRQRRANLSRERFPWHEMILPKSKLNRVKTVLVIFLFLGAPLGCVFCRIRVEMHLSQTRKPLTCGVSLFELPIQRQIPLAGIPIAPLSNRQYFLFAFPVFFSVTSRPEYGSQRFKPYDDDSDRSRLRGELLFC